MVWKLQQEKPRPGKRQPHPTEAPRFYRDWRTRESAMTTTRQLALAEKRSASTAEQAEAEYRADWWALTLHLGEPGTKKEIGQRYDAAQRVLDLSNRYLGERRRTGAALAVLEYRQIADLPPRKTMAAVQAGAEFTPAMLTRLRKDETLRDFAESLGQSFENTPRAIAKAVKNDPKAAAAAAAALSDGGAGHLTFDQAADLTVAVSDHAVAHKGGNPNGKQHIGEPAWSKALTKISDGARDYERERSQMSAAQGRKADEKASPIIDHVIACLANTPSTVDV